MDEAEWLTERFEQHRPHLRAVAYRMLGSVSESDDALQEAWLRIREADPEGIQNMRAWLTTVVGRVCLNMLRSRRARREKPWVHVPDPVVSFEEHDGEHEALHHLPPAFAGAPLVAALRCFATSSSSR